MAPLIALMLSTAAMAEEIEELKPKRVEVPGAGITLNVPMVPEGELQPWTWNVNDVTTDVRVSMRKSTAYTDVVFGATSYQPDLANMPIERFTASLVDSDDEDTVVTLGEPIRADHEVVGTSIRIAMDVRDNWMERDLWGEGIVFLTEGSAVTVRTLSAESAERATEVLDEVLSMIEVNNPPVPEADLPYGEYRADAGWKVQLPKGWRMLTAEEGKAFSTNRIAGEGPFRGKLARAVAIDPSYFGRAVFECNADTRSTLEIIDPAKSPISGENFLTFAKVSLRGGSYRVVNGNEDLVIEILSELPLHVDEGTQDPLEFIQLSDREAYLWGADGSIFEDPYRASLFYTTYADVGLTCVGLAPIDEAATVGTFDSMIRNLEVVDGELYPMPLSLQARYRRWWPTSNPFLQLYWLPLPLMLLAGWIVVKSD